MLPNIKNLTPSVLLGSLLVAAPAMAAPVKIMPVGDSITEGYTPNPPNGTGLGTASYREEFENWLIADGCSYQMVGQQTTNYPSNPTVFTSNHEGWSGHRVDELLDITEPHGGISGMMSNANNADVVLLHAGSNDIRIGQTPQSTANEISTVINQILSANSSATVLVANVIPWWGSAPNGNVTADIATLGDEIAALSVIANNPNVILVNVRNGFTQGMMQTDLIHPKASGEAHIADAFYDVFEQAGLCLDETIPETFISTPAEGQFVGETTTYSGTATDAGSSGFDTVRIAIRDRNTGDWYNFTDGTFGNIEQNGVAVGIADANLTGTSLTSTNWKYTVTQPLPDGDYTLFALAIDNAGNDAFTDAGLSVWPVNTDFSVDAAIPTGVATSPQDGDIIESSTRNISGTSSDVGSGVSRVRVRIQALGVSPTTYWNGTSWSTTPIYLDATLNADATLWQLPSVDLTQPGQYRVRLIVTDNTGNTARVTSNPKTDFTVGIDDNTDPTAQATSPGNGDDITPGITKISGSAFDADSGVSTVRARIRRLGVSPALYWGGSTWSNSSVFLDASLSADGTAWELAGVDLNETGTYRVNVIAYDNAGNLAQSFENPKTDFTVSIDDDTDPIAQATSPGNGDDTPPGVTTITGTAFDADSGVSTVRVRVRQLGVSPALYWDGATWNSSSVFLDASLNAGGTAWTLAGVSLNETGSYRVHVIAYDNAGNLAQSFENPKTDFTVSIDDDTDPTAQATSPGNSDNVSPGTTTISGTAFDADSGVSIVRVRIRQLGVSPALYWDGSTWGTPSIFLDTTINTNGTTWSLAGVELSSASAFRVNVIAYDNAGNLAQSFENPSTDFTTQ